MYYNEYDLSVYNNEIKEFLPSKIIDSHAHVWLDKFILNIETKKRGVNWIKLVANDNPCDELMNTYKTVFQGIDVEPVIFGFPDVNTDIEISNNYVLKQPFRKLVLSLPEWTADKLYAEIKRGFCGLKPYFTFAPKHISENEITIFDYLPKHHLEVCNEFGLPVVLHIPRSNRLKDKMNLQQLLEIDKKFKNVKLVIAHIGRMYCKEDFADAFEVLKQTKNLYFDFSANCLDLAMENVLKYFGSERLIFGSDLPITKMRMQRISVAGKYLNLVPKGLYGDLSGEVSMGELPDLLSEKLTLFINEEILACKRAVTACKMGRNDVENIFYNNSNNIF